MTSWPQTQSTGSTKSCFSQVVFQICFSNWSSGFIFRMCVPLLYVASRSFCLPSFALSSFALLSFALSSFAWPACLTHVWLKQRLLPMRSVQSRSASVPSGCVVKPIRSYLAELLLLIQPPVQHRDSCDGSHSGFREGHESHEDDEGDEEDTLTSPSDESHEAGSFLFFCVCFRLFCVSVLCFVSI